MIRKMWTGRLSGCQRNVDVWQQLLQVRAIVVAPKEDTPTWLKFASICRKNGRQRLALKVILRVLSIVGFIK